MAANPGQVKMYWSKREKDLMFDWNSPASKSDSHLLHNVLCNKRFLPSFLSPKEWQEEKSLIDELEERGYDITTLKFSIKKKVE